MKNYIYNNSLIGKKEISQLLGWSFSTYNFVKTYCLADELKLLGFKYSTKSGISLSIEDLQVTYNKLQFIKHINNFLLTIEKEYLENIITESERYQKIVVLWDIFNNSLKDQTLTFFNNYDPFNSVYVMSSSGARGNLLQVKQLIAMRGLISNQKGQLVNLPILKNFQEGLTITDYLMSGYGARKGVIDTSLKTATSGYLTRRLVEVAHNILIREKDCKSKYSLTVEKINFKFSNNLIGCILNKPVLNSNFLIKKNTIITSKIIQFLNSIKIKKIYIRSPLTCILYNSICQKCYGWNLANETLIDIGIAVGVLAGQSIGEPGTQLTMRTFHTGGVVNFIDKKKIHYNHIGIIQYNKNLKIKKIRLNSGDFVNITTKEGSIILIPTKKSQKIKKLIIPKNTILFLKNNQYINNSNNAIGELENRKKKNYIQQLPILTKSSGEIKSILLKKKVLNLNSKKLTWILEGELYNTFFYSNIFINFYPDYKINKENFVFRSKIINLTNIFIQFNKNKLTNLRKIKKFHTYIINDYNLKKIKKINFLVLNIKKQKYLLKFYNKNSLNAKNIGYLLLNSLKIFKNGVFFYNTALSIKTTKNKYIILIKKNKFYNINFKSTIFQIIKKKLYKLKQYKKLYYPGEIFKFKKDIILESNRSTFYKLRIYEIPNLKYNSIYKKKGYKIINKLVIYKSNRKIRTNGVFNFIKIKLNIPNFDNIKFFLDKKNFFKLQFNQKINILKNDLNICFLVKNYQYLSKFSLLSYLEFITKNTEEIVKFKIKKKENKIKQLFIIYNKNCFIVNKLTSLKNKNQSPILFFKNKHMNTGKILFSNKNYLIIQKGLLYITITSKKQKNQFFYKDKDFLNKNQLLGFILIEKNIINDIIQGLPLIEKYLEIKFKNILFNNYLAIKKNNKQKKLFLKTRLDFFGNFKRFNFNFNKNKEINVHLLLYNYFNYFFLCKIKTNFLFTNYTASYNSFKELQFYLLKNIQSIYQSQGVFINDKHLKIIITNMTSNVLVLNIGDSPLIKYEIIDLYHANYINNTLIINSLSPIIYVPILQGITKISLNNKSFLAASSFQSTISVLMKASLEGKIDWLQGLKENIIVGNSIPAGTRYPNFRNAFNKD
uniref:DNA-directed RNA polymerase n=1 Tax=Nitzschia sp. IriIs04 TaxID=1444690 RepID=A0A0S3QPK4_9STRA|nr:RNA polymerase beta'' subunit [Nitzschia sp. IriIs04]BAT70266.1 RNA polymerase beta'' subunit [Nitzschia sp. IriIs04]